LWQDDEAYFNRARITSILPLDYCVWVGTGEGSLITYDVFTHTGSKVTLKRTMVVVVVVV
jgi:hypothetical protein